METHDKNARELLAFYRNAGVDALLGEEAIDRFADDLPAFSSPEGGRSSSDAAQVGLSTTRAQDAPPSPLSAEGALRAAVPPPSAQAAVMSARAAAKSAESLHALRALLETFEGCMLRTTATRLVFADGNPKGRVMFVGEAPGRDEDIAGLPFVGRSGKLLDLMMRAIGLDRTQVYIANIVPWRPPAIARRRRTRAPSACPS